MNNLLQELNSEQMKAVKQIEGPLLILAGAGSGKTRVLTNRTAYMIGECGIDPYNILAITFTNKAASEMRSRIDDMVGYGSESIWVSTFHSMCVRILRRYADHIGFSNSFTIYDTDDSKTVMKDVCKRLNIDTKQLSERYFLGCISSAKDELVSVEDMEKKAVYDSSFELVDRVYREYQNTLKKSNAFDFDDLIVKTVELFRSDPEVLENYQDRFRYIMVDEYQDTNTAQFELIRLLALKYKNICVVGDDDQSIYKFRGANIRNILDFEKHYKNATVIKLEENYRSTQNILDAANAVIRNNIGRKDKSLWTKKGRGERIHYRQLESAYDEADFITENIRKKKRDGELEYSDTAVLYRTNAQSRLIEERFIMAGIPYNVVGGVNFYSRREIKDILCYLKTIDNARDDLAVKRIINVPKRGIGATTISKVDMFAIANGLSFYEALKRADMYLPGKTYVKIREFVDMIEGFREEKDSLTVEDMLNNILDETEYIENMEASDEFDAKARVENIEELINKAVAFEEGNTFPEGTEIMDGSGDITEGMRESRLSAFLEEVALVADIDSVSDEDNRVLLMTLHSAKGLEFSDVYITGLEEGLFPGYMSISSDDDSDMEEERRLCYVGITRAEKNLVMTSARSRMVRGEVQYHAPSRFISEIPNELFDQKPRMPRIRREDIPSAGSMGPDRSVFHSKPYMLPESSQKNRTAVKSKPRATGMITRGADLVNTFEKPDYVPGDRVKHIKFGDGTVLALEKGKRDYEVSVDFDTYGVKKMFANFAKLIKL
ncbi:MAG: UvrD-helicase domain-containing protein [Lachnospiraceae bacterium]|nr:UvrD-helicase domain-containing protein [Lachnospiraceae bacterium]